MKFERRLTSVAQEIIKDYVQDRERLTMLDATVGNGNDTLFLANLAKGKSYIYGFDIQEEAIKQTKEKLNSYFLGNNIMLVSDSHEYIDKYITGNIDVAMFNLGYLPQGNKNIITNTKSTITAITKTMEKLSDNGIITILAYPGHDGGDEENIAIYTLLKTYSAKKYDIGKIDIVNTNGNPPVLYIVSKI